MVRNQRGYLDFRMTHLTFRSLNFSPCVKTFRGLCTGEFGRGTDTNYRRRYVGTKVHKLICGAIPGR
jgi:hypothetical protein